MSNIKRPSIGGFNAGRGSIQALHPKQRDSTQTEVTYSKLTDWERNNNFTRAQTRRFIKQNKLLAAKHNGVWWVAINPKCEELPIDF